jgi:preprotein translocase subunit SecA
MRIFGGQNIARLMDLIKADEEMPIEAGMVTKSIENAQKKVEAYHFDMRKHVLQYDDVLNTQREVIYRERRRILVRDSLREECVQMVEDHVDILLNNHIDPETPPETWEETDLPTLMAALAQDIPMFGAIEFHEVAGYSFIDLREKLLEAARLAYQTREEHVGIPVMRELERQILMRTIDTKWIDYLHNIEQLREGIHLRGYGQRDPLQEYKREAYELFEQLLRSIQTESVQLMFHAQPVQMQYEGDPALYGDMELPEGYDPSTAQEDYDREMDMSQEAAEDAGMTGIERGEELRLLDNDTAGAQNEANAGGGESTGTNGHNGDGAEKKGNGSAGGGVDFNESVDDAIKRTQQ